MTTFLIALFFSVVVGLGTMNYTKKSFGKIKWLMVATWAACAFMLVYVIQLFTN